MPAESEDKALYVKRLAEGNEAAWRRFFDEHGRIVLNLAARLGVPPDDREEVLQNTCIICSRSIDQLRDPERLSSWVYRIAYRQSLETRTRRRRDPIEDRDPSDLADTSGIEGRSIEDLVVEAELASHLRAAVDDLGGACRQLLALLYLQEPRPSYEDVSAQLDMPIGSIGPTRARCLEKLRKRFESVSGTG